MYNIIYNIIRFSTKLEMFKKSEVPLMIKISEINIALIHLEILSSRVYGNDM